MKKYIHAILVFSIISFTASAQTEHLPQAEPLLNPGTPSWLSDKGYWVIESNVKTPRKSIVHFYNNDNVVVYREKVEGIKINLNRKKTLYRLKGALEQVIVAWEKEKILKENEEILAKALK
jgi:hypothetical protein